MKILVIEDDAVIGDQLRRALEKEDFVVDWERNGDDGLRQAGFETYGLIVLDIMMPGADGWTICRAIRDRRDRVPILMLTARDAVADRVRGLDLGADDYLVKPFDVSEFLARVRALLRREKPQKSSLMRFRGIELDAVGKSVSIRGELTHLTPKEFSLLEALMRNRGRILSRETIVDSIWSEDESLYSTVNYHVMSLRKKVDADGEPSIIETVHGFGYRLKEVE